VQDDEDLALLKAGLKRTSKSTPQSLETRKVTVEMSYTPPNKYQVVASAKMTAIAQLGEE
jgi:hypothetical protein